MLYPYLPYHDLNRQAYSHIVPESTYRAQRYVGFKSVSSKEKKKRDHDEHQGCGLNPRSTKHDETCRKRCSRLCYHLLQLTSAPHYIETHSESWIAKYKAHKPVVYLKHSCKLVHAFLPIFALWIGGRDDYQVCLNHTLGLKFW